MPHIGDQRETPDRQLMAVSGRVRAAAVKDVLEWLTTQLASRIGELLPHRWQITAAAR